MPFGVWIFVRLLVPTGPILIQYLLSALGLYKPPFPQATYVVLLFSLSLVTLTEYQSLPLAIYGSVIPAISASVLYTAYILNIERPEYHYRTLLFGFYLWTFLVVVNVLRILIDIVGRTSKGRRA